VVACLPMVEPQYAGNLAALEALVAGLLLNVTLQMGGRIQQRTQEVIMLLAFGALLFKVSALLIVLKALVWSTWCSCGDSDGTPPSSNAPPPSYCAM